MKNHSPYLYLLILISSAPAPVCWAVCVARSDCTACILLIINPLIYNELIKYQPDYLKQKGFEAAASGWVWDTFCVGQLVACLASGAGGIHCFAQYQACDQICNIIDPTDDEL